MESTNALTLLIQTKRPTFASSLNSVPEKYPAVRLAHEADENIEESGPADSISECTDTVHCCKFLYKFIMLYVVLYNRHVCLLF